MNSLTTAQPRSSVPLEELAAGDRLRFRTLSGSEYVFSIDERGFEGGALTLKGELRGGTLPVARRALIGYALTPADSISGLLSVGGRAVLFAEPVAAAPGAPFDRITTTVILELAIERATVTTAA